jgi:hypothetical protein
MRFSLPRAAGGIMHGWLQSVVSEASAAVTICRGSPGQPCG